MRHNLFYHIKCFKTQKSEVEPCSNIQKMIGNMRIKKFELGTDEKLISDFKLKIKQKLKNIKSLKL